MASLPTAATTEEDGSGGAPTATAVPVISSAPLPSAAATAQDLRRMAAAARAFGSASALRAGSSSSSTSVAARSDSVGSTPADATGSIDTSSARSDSESASLLATSGGRPTLASLGHKRTNSTSSASSSSLDPASRLKAAGKAVMAVAPTEQRRRRLEELGIRKPSKTGKLGLTPAQAMTRVTGTIFDRDEDVPRVLHAPLVAVVAAYDSYRKSLDTVKASVESLVYWEALVGSLSVVGGIVLSWVIGRLGFGVLSVLFIMVFLGSSVRHDLIIVKEKMQAHATRILGLRRVENESEYVEWLNKFVARLWTQMEPSLSDSIKSSVNSSLSAAKPAFMEDLSLSTFTLGSIAPRIETIRTIFKTSDDFHLMDWELNFVPVDDDMAAKRDKELGPVRQSKIELVAKIRNGISLPVVVTDLTFKAKLRIGIKFMSKYPHIKTIEYSLLESPNFDFIIRPLKGLDLMDTPGLQTFLNDIVASAMLSYVEPHKNSFDMEAFFGGSDDESVAGLLRITIYEARDLKNVELAGVSDPFAVVKIGGKEVARTSVVDGSLHPFWGETYFVPVLKSQLAVETDLLSSRKDDLKIELFDHNDTLKHKDDALASLGSNAEITNNGATATGAKGSGKTRGEVRIDMAYFPTVSVIETKVESVETTTTEKPNASENAVAATSETNAEAKTTNTGSVPTVEPKSNSASEPAQVSNSAPGAPRKSVDAAEESERKLAEETERKAYVASLTTGVLTVTVHQAHTKEGSDLGTATVQIRDVINQPSGTTLDDWFKLDTVPTGKLRLTFKWDPVDLNAQGGGSKVLRKEPIGLARVKIVEAKGVANVETFRKSDPYCKLFLARQAFGSTNVRDNTLDPVWNETFFSPYYGRSETLRLEVWDYNNVKKDRTLGRVEFILSDLIAAANGGETKDPNFSRCKADGLSVKDSGDGVLRIEELDADAAKEFARATTKASLSSAATPATTTVGSIGGVRQKGFLQFELELSPVVVEHYIRPETDVEREARENQYAEAEAELRRIHLLEEVGVVKRGEDGSEPEQLVKSKERLEELDNLKPTKILEEYSCGIIRLRVHRATGLKRAYNSYAEVFLDDESVFLTRPHRRTAAPSWDALGDIYVRDAPRQKLTLQLRAVPKEEGTKVSSDDPVLAEWNGKLADVVGKKGAAIELKDASGAVACTLTFSAGYAPVVLRTGGDQSKNSGVLYLDIVEAIQLEAVDSGGTSDPYCVVNLGASTVYKTKVLKKNLNPIFNESCVVQVRSRQRETLTVVVRDHNAIGKHTTLGTVSVELAKVKPDELVDAILPLEGARGGTLHLRLLIDPRPEAWEEARRAAGIRSASDADSMTSSTAADGGSKPKGGLGALLGRQKTVAAPVSGPARKSAAQRSSEIGSPTVRWGAGAPIGKSVPATPASEAIAVNRGVAAAQEPSIGQEVPYLVVKQPSPLVEVDGSEAGSVAASESWADGLSVATRSGTFTITIVEARGLKPVDAGGTSDPFVVVSQVLHGKSKTLHKTKVIKKTLSPRWSAAPGSGGGEREETVTVRVPPARVSFAVRDHNVLAESKPLGEAAGDLFTLLGVNQGSSAPPRAAFDVW
ncbi:hypothetical protein HK405_004027, partial [Cladochytrium tenue]